MTQRNLNTQKSPILRGAAFQAAYRTGNGANFLYLAVKRRHKRPAPFAKVEEALNKLADRVAWRLLMAGDVSVGTKGNNVVSLARSPNLHVIEVTELLALVFEDAPVATYDRHAPGATFWNWWDWAAGGKSDASDLNDSTMTDLARDERLAAGAAAVAVLNARAANTLVY